MDDDKKPQQDPQSQEASTPNLEEAKEAAPSAPGPEGSAPQKQDTGAAPKPKFQVKSSPFTPTVSGGGEVSQRASGKAPAKPTAVTSGTRPAPAPGTTAGAPNPTQGTPKGAPAPEAPGVGILGVAIDALAAVVAVTGAVMVFLQL